MKKIFIFSIFLFLTLYIFAQKDVTKFLGIPVDGPRSEFVSALKAKGFKTEKLLGDEIYKGRFNGYDVSVYVITENGKVCRVMICDEIAVDEPSIKTRFNLLCQQFKDNGKYLSLHDFTIPDDEDISYEMAVEDKRYDALFYQLPDSETLEKIKSDAFYQIAKKYTPEQLKSSSDSIKQEMMDNATIAILDAIKDKTVWFRISEHLGKYTITMYYDNELNRAHGQDL